MNNANNAGAQVNLIYGDNGSARITIHLPTQCKNIYDDHDWTYHRDCPPSLLEHMDEEMEEYQIWDEELGDYHDLRSQAMRETHDELEEMLLKQFESDRKKRLAEEERQEKIARGELKPDPEPVPEVLENWDEDIVSEN